LAEPIVGVAPQSFQLIMLLTAQLLTGQHCVRTLSLMLWTNQTGLSRLAALLAVFLWSPVTQSQVQSPAATWSFDENGGSIARGVGAGDANLTGVYRWVDGVRGKALRMDGETSGATVPAAQTVQLGDSFTVAAWVAIDAYPWNWAPIVDQRKEENSGFLFGIDSFGRPGLQLAVGGNWQFLTSKTPLPLKRWSYVAATFSPADGMSLYVDGSVVGHRLTKGEFEPAPGQDLLIGRVRYPMLPAQWLHPKFPVMFSFDGELDEIKIWNSALSAGQLRDDFAGVHAPSGDVLPYPKLPSGPPGVGPFGGFYTTLRYDEMWDAPRRVGADSDVVVRFDEMPVRLVSWQGTNYVPAWVTENGKWYSDEFVETGGLPGCPFGLDCEPMSDKQNQYAHVRVLESSPARTVLHFRYGQCEVERSVCANPDAETGWTDWADDYYTVYPDGVAARKTIAWTSNFETWHEFQETMVINAAGTRPEDNIQTDALTFVNMKGETATYSWEHPPTVIDKPSGANIQVVNLKSEWKPFQIVRPEKPQISTYVGEKTYSMFEWWNHWPVALVKSSGISAVAPDRPSHSSLSHIEGAPVGQNSNSIKKIMLDGLTNRPPSALAKLAASWISPPAIQVTGDGFKSEGYDAGQRAFVVRGTGSQANPKLTISLAATEGSPLVNPCVVIHHWGEAGPLLKVNGRAVTWGSNYRYGLVPSLEGDSLVVWIQLEATQATTIGIEGKQ
jgi:Concanavalin A-like lectin/glucanases superfamily